MRVCRCGRRLVMLGGSSSGAALPLVGHLVLNTRPDHYPLPAAPISFPRRFAERSKPAASGPKIPPTISRFRIRSARACIRVVIINSRAPGSPLSASRTVAGLSAAWPLPGRWRRGKAVRIILAIQTSPAGRLALQAVVVNQTLGDQLPATAGLPSPHSWRSQRRYLAFSAPGSTVSTPSSSGSLRRECEPATMRLVSGPAMIGRCACRF